MIFFVLTRTGYDELLQHFGRSPSPLWVNDGVLSSAELMQLRHEGIAVTNFANVIDTKNLSAVNSAIETIQEHHEGQRVWVEFV